MLFVHGVLNGCDARYECDALFDMSDALLRAYMHYGVSHCSASESASRQAGKWVCMAYTVLTCRECMILHEHVSLITLLHPAFRPPLTHASPPSQTYSPSPQHNSTLPIPRPIPRYPIRPMHIPPRQPSTTRYLLIAILLFHNRLLVIAIRLVHYTALCLARMSDSRLPHALEELGGAGLLLRGGARGRRSYLACGCVLSWRAVLLGICWRG
jgi:hypothetical protein